MKLFGKYFIRLFYSNVLAMQWGTTHEALFINAHFVQNRGERKHWWIKLWRIGYQPPNPPKFSPANVLCYTVDEDINSNSMVLTPSEIWKWG